MQIVQKISIFVFSSLFLILSSGVMIIKHECTSCETTEIVFSANHKHECETQKTCCNTKKTHCQLPAKEDNHSHNSSCCHDDEFFFKIENEFVRSSLSFDFQKLIKTSFLPIFYFIEKIEQKTTPNFIQEKPPLLLIFSQNLPKISRLIL